MKRALLGIAVLLAAPTDEQPPEAALGTITAAITPIEAVETAEAIDRNLGLTYQGRIEPDSGQATFADLLPGRYDLVIETADGARFEGADLATRESELEEQARQAEQEQGVADEPPGPLTEQDRAALREHVFAVKRFEDYRKVDAIEGNARRATLLVELLRRRPFHGMKGKEVIWRVELWYFAKQAGGWEHVANADGVLHRQRMAAEDFAVLRRVFTPALGGIAVDLDGASAPVSFAIPADARTDEGFQEGAS